MSPGRPLLCLYCVADPEQKGKKGRRKEHREGTVRQHKLIFKYPIRDVVTFDPGIMTEKDIISSVTLLCVY